MNHTTRRRKNMHSPNPERTRIAVFIASHFTYDAQEHYLHTCLSSLLDQTTEVDIYVSISYDLKYESVVRNLPCCYDLPVVKFLIRDTQTSQMNHIRLLTNEFAHRHKLIMFCDDDDTYEPERVDAFNKGNDFLIKSKSRNQIVLTDDTNLQEFWAYAFVPEQLHCFFDLFQTDAQKRYLDGTYADMMLRLFIRNFKKMCVSCRLLYNYRRHDESVCVTAEKRHIKSEDEKLVLYVTKQMSKEIYSRFITSDGLKYVEFYFVNIMQNPKVYKLFVRSSAEKWKYKKFLYKFHKILNKKAADKNEENKKFCEELEKELNMKGTDITYV